MSRWFGRLLVLVAWVLPGVLGYGALHFMPIGMSGDGWAAATYASLGWLAAGAVLGAIYQVARNTSQDGRLLAVAAGAGLFLAAAVLFTLGTAVDHERQNYWDAYHFSALIWAYFLASGASLWASFSASRHGSLLGGLLRVPAALSCFVGLLWWLWTWMPWVQDLQGWITQLAFQLTHG